MEIYRVGSIGGGREIRKGKRDITTHPRRIKTAHRGRIIGGATCCFLCLTPKGLHVPPFYLQRQMEYYTLSREQIQAIATRAAELAIEQVLNGSVPTIQRPMYKIGADDPNADPIPDHRELTQFERNAMAALFGK